jgi:hypothetical protein
LAEDIYSSINPFKRKEKKKIKNKYCKDPADPDYLLNLLDALLLTKST